jgi:organic radical activating enzyme
VQISCVKTANLGRRVPIMSDVFPPVSDSRTLSLMPTFKCTAACQQCGTMSSPRESTWLDIDLMEKAVDEAAAAGYEAVVFTGGEATLADTALVELIARAHAHDLQTRLVTNAWWAEDVESTDQFLAGLQDAGLDELNVSTGDQHARFVTIDRPVRAAARAALKQFSSVVIMVEVLDRSCVTKQVIERELMSYRLGDEQVKPIIILESPWMPLAPTRSYKYPEGCLINKDNVDACSGCDSILNTTTVQADGRIGACCGQGLRLIPELNIGHISEMSIDDALRRSQDDLMMRWIRFEGPERILAWASRHDPSISWENMYAHRCQACRRIYTDDRVKKVIRANFREKVAELICREWVLRSASV